MQEAQKKLLDDNTGIQARMKKLEEREQAVEKIEAALEEQAHALRNTPQIQPQTSDQPYAGLGYNPYPNATASTIRRKSLYEQARNDGITLYTTGRSEMGVTETQTKLPSEQSTGSKAGFFNVGSTLFKSAMMMLFIVAFESLVVFFMKDYLQIPAYYPAIGFGVGFIAFIICAILYARGYKASARRKKHPSYFLTAAILFVISVIAVTMVAVYLKAQLSNPTQLLSYVIIPIAYFANILIFATFYYTFSFREAAKN